MSELIVTPFEPSTRGVDDFVGFVISASNAPR